MSSKTKLYGEWVVTIPPVKAMAVDRILGAQIVHDKKGRPDRVVIQWQSAGSGVQAIEMDYPNALFLLSSLKCIQLDEGTAFPDDPRVR